MNIGKVDNTGVACDLTVRPDLLTGCPIFTRLKVGYGYISQKHTSERDIYRSLYALDYLRHKLSVQLDHRIWSRLDRTLEHEMAAAHERLPSVC